MKDRLKSLPAEFTLPVPSKPQSEAQRLADELAHMDHERWDVLDRAARELRRIDFELACANNAIIARDDREDKHLAALRQAREALEQPQQCKRCKAYATLVKAQEEELSYHRAQADKYQEAIDTLHSERQANAALTEELEACRAENAPSPFGKD